MPSRRTNNVPESVRGVGHVTPTIFGSTVGCPSDSLASCVNTEHLLNATMDLYDGSGGDINPNTS